MERPHPDIPPNSDEFIQRDGVWFVQGLGCGTVAVERLTFPGYERWRKWTSRYAQCGWSEELARIEPLKGIVTSDASTVNIVAACVRAGVNIDQWMKWGYGAEWDSMKGNT